MNYLDVGLKLEVEPLVHLEDDVGIKVGLEVSNIAQQIRSASGTVAYQVGTRNAATTLRLKDGETNILAGLIRDDERTVLNGVPGLVAIGKAGWRGEVHGGVADPAAGARTPPGTSGPRHLPHRPHSYPHS